MSVQNQVANAFSGLSLDDKHIVVALSGGIDSVVLLDAVKRLSSSNVKISAVHVHHGLSDAADEWLAFCQKLCQQYQITFYAEKVRLTDMDKGIEAAAREARYQALAKYVEPNTLLLTAQHQDDQCETLLLALKRGSGVRGLAGMPPELPFRQGLLLRPLLNVTRSAIEGYAKLHSLSWVEDASNRDDKFDRNFLRLEVLPKLNQRWQGFSGNVARTANLCQQANQLLDEIASQDLAQVSQQKDKLCLNNLREMSTPRINNVLRMWLRQFQLEMPSQQVMEQIVAQMLQGKIDSDPLIVLGRFSLRRYQQSLYLVSDEKEMSKSHFSWSMSKPLALGDRLGSLVISPGIAHQSLRKPLQDELVTVRFVIPGSIKSWPLGRDKRRSVKKLMQEYQVPTWQRKMIPFIFYGENLVAAVGLWVDKEYLASEGQEAINVEWLHKT